MEKKYDDLSIQEAMRLAQSDTGQQLLQFLKSGHGNAAQQALAQAQKGDIAQAQQTLRAFLSDPKTQALLRRLQEEHHG
jgi:hypothetical protein